MTYDYFKIVEELSSVHMKLMSSCHDYFFDLRHDCYMTADLKHAYSTVEVHSEDRKYFAFTILDLRQLQPTRMQQGSMSAFFIMSELICRALREIFENIDYFDELSFLQSVFSNSFSLLIFYQNDILSDHSSFETQFAFFKDHFFSRIEWARLKLFFKKLFLFQKTIKALNLRHYVKNMIQILENRISKIIKFFTPTDKTDIRFFLEIIGIIHR